MAAKNNEFKTEGNLGTSPLPLLFAQILDEKLTGLLHIEAQDVKYWVYFDEGFPAGVHNPKSQAYLGSVMREIGFIDDATFNQSLMLMAEQKKLQGQILLGLGAIDDKQLDKALSLQLARKLSQMFTLKEGSFRFAEDEDLPPPQEPIRINPYSLIYNAIRSNYEIGDLKKGLAGLVGKSVKVSRKFVERGALFEFPEEDLADAKILEQFRLPQEFAKAAKCGPTAAMMLLLTLEYCNMLELEEPDFSVPITGIAHKRPAPKATPPPPSAPSSPRPGQQHKPGNTTPPASSTVSNISKELLEKINEKFEQIRDAEPWEILEVEREADGDRLKKAFLTMAKVYHPDRVANCQDEEITHRVDMIITKINESYQILADPHARMAYMAEKGRSKKPGEPSKPRPEEAKIQFQKAMVFFKKKDLAKAAECLRWAADMDPEDGDYLAWRHWVDYLRSTDPQDVKFDKVKGDLLALTKAKPDSFHAARFLSMLFKKINDKANYERFLVKAHKLDKHDVETARELRLFRARKEKAESKGKFLGIRFKKSDD